MKSRVFLLFALAAFVVVPATAIGGCSSGTNVSGAGSSGSNGGDGGTNGDGSSSEGGNSQGDAGGDASVPIVPGTHFDGTAAPWTLPGTGLNLYAPSGYDNETGGGDWSALDIDGDGKLDLVVTAAFSANEEIVLGGASAAYWNVYRGGGSGFSSTATKWTLPATGLNLYAPTGYDNETGGGDWTTVDIDGDGKLDLVVTAAFSANEEIVLGGASAAYWNVYRGTGSGFATTATKWTLPPTGLNLYAPSGYDNETGGGDWSTLDVDGDGKPDLVVTAAFSANEEIVLGGASAAYWNVYRGTGSGFATTATKWVLPATGLNLYAPSGYDNETGGGDWSTLDVDGDGKPDLVVTAAFSANEEIVLGGASSAYWNVYRGGGTGFATTATKWVLPATGLNLYAPSGYDNETGGGDWTTADIDGDGKLDLVVSAAFSANEEIVLGGASAAYWNVYRGTGTSFSSTLTKWMLPATGLNLYAPSGYDNETGGGDWSLLDIDGDHRPDLIVTAAFSANEEIVLGGASAPYWNAYLNAP